MRIPAEITSRRAVHTERLKSVCTYDNCTVYLIDFHGFRDSFSLFGAVRFAIINWLYKFRDSIIRKFVVYVRC